MCIRDSDSGCKSGEFCKFTSGECGGEGTCEDTPDVCTTEFNPGPPLPSPSLTSPSALPLLISCSLLMPVCGCDNRTHSNQCNADKAGVSVRYVGKCESTSSPLSWPPPHSSCAATCKTSKDCKSGEFCKFTSGKCRDEGTCEDKPSVCIMEYKPGPHSPLHSSPASLKLTSCSVWL